MGNGLRDEVLLLAPAALVDTLGVANGAANQKPLEPHGTIAPMKVTPSMGKSAKTGVISTKTPHTSGVILKMAVGTTALHQECMGMGIMDVTGRQDKWRHQFYSIH